MSNNNFYTPETVRPLYAKIVPAYRQAFAVPPWNEVSKCVDEQVRCEGGLSAVAIGKICDMCGLCPTRPAYEVDELTERFDTLGRSRPTAWYAEQNVLGLTMAAVAWKALPSGIAIEKYPDAPEMTGWMVDRLGDEPVMWLDEVFSDRTKKPAGNLSNFRAFVTGLASRLQCDTVAYRTVEPKMTEKALRVFGNKATVFAKEVAVPDRRDFVTIRNVQEAL